MADLNAEYLRSMETGFVSLPRVRLSVLCCVRRLYTGLMMLTDDRLNIT